MTFEESIFEHLVVASKGLKVGIRVKPDRLILDANANHVVRNDNSNETLGGVCDSANRAGARDKQVSVLNTQHLDCVQLFFLKLASYQ